MCCATHLIGRQGYSQDSSTTIQTLTQFADSSHPFRLTLSTKDLVQDMIELVRSRLLNVIPSVLFNLIDFSRAKNNLMRFQPLCFLKELPAYE